MKHDFSELRLDRVTRRFAGAGGKAFNALDELTLTIKRGEFIALLGPSGCGKSTALNCIAGLLQLSGGSIWLDQTRIDTLPPEKRGFGMVFQNYALFPHMSVAKNVGFGLRMRGVTGGEIADARVAHAMKLVQLVGQEHKLPGQLSGGQQQRVAIARAIVIEPPLILMDEPLSNLDAKLRIETRAEIRRIHRELDRATIYVTHDQDEALVARRPHRRDEGRRRAADRRAAGGLRAAVEPARRALHGLPQRARARRRARGGRSRHAHRSRHRAHRGAQAAAQGHAAPRSRSGRRISSSARTPAAPTRSSPRSRTSSTAAAIRCSTSSRPSGTLLHVRGPVTTARGDSVRVHVPVERALVYPLE